MTPDPRYIALIREGRFYDAMTAFHDAVRQGYPHNITFRDWLQSAGYTLTWGTNKYGDAHLDALKRALIACALDLAGYPETTTSGEAGKETT